MYQFHGWIVLEESPDETDDDVMQEIAQDAQRLIDSFQWGSGVLEIRIVNAQYYVLIAGLTNHRTEEADDLERLFAFVGERAPGSYGLLYIWDDEENGWPGRNAFKVRLLVRGKTFERADPFFSPIAPVVEDDGD